MWIAPDTRFDSSHEESNYQTEISCQDSNPTLSGQKLTSLILGSGLSLHVDQHKRKAYVHGLAPGIPCRKDT